LPIVDVQFQDIGAGHKGPPFWVGAASRAAPATIVAPLGSRGLLRFQSLIEVLV
jgi:hypothetical protein